MLYRKMNSSDFSSSDSDPFELIEQGNDFETKLKYFKASEAFLSASRILEEKAVNAFPTKPRNAKEQSKIAALYRDKSLEYFQHARRCFISGLEREHEIDITTHLKQPSAVEQVVSMMGQWREEDISFRNTIPSSFIAQDLHLRKTLFQKLYSTNRNPTQEEKIQSKSLEERLALLESSLPTRLKSEKERYKDLSKGLAKLGVTNHYKDVPPSFLLEDVESSDELDQVEQVIQMATDSVTFEGGTTSSVQEVMDIMEMHNIQDANHTSNSDCSMHDSISDGLPHVEPSMERVQNLIQSITQRIKEDTELMPEIDSTSTSTKEKLKVWINEAQQLLVQASLCLEDLDTNTNKVGEDEVNHDKNDIPLSNPNGSSVESETESNGNVQKNPIFEIGRSGLLEVQKLVEQMLISWPNK